MRFLRVPDTFGMLSGLSRNYCVSSDAARYQRSSDARLEASRGGKFGTLVMSNKTYITRALWETFSLESTKPVRYMERTISYHKYYGLSR